MNQCDPQDNNDRLERATDALRSSERASAPPERMMNATIQSLNALSEENRPAVAKRNGRHVRRFGKRFGRFVLAAAGLVLVVFILVSLRADRTFADVLEKVAKARSVQFVVKHERDGSSLPTARMWLQDEMLRHELANGDLVMILDGSDRKGLELHRQRKVAKRIDLVGRIPAEELKDPVDRLRNLKNQKGAKADRLPDEKIDGRDCHVFQVTGASALRMPGPWKLWVDPKTNLPVRMRIGDEKSSLTFEQFVWGKPLSRDLFSLKLPEGYVLETAVAAKIVPGRIHFHKGADFHSIAPDGKSAERQFVPRRHREGGSYDAGKCELSPDGRYLAIGYSAQRQKATHPPERILLWDRTRPEAEATELYSRPGAELQHWSFSPDGKRLYVSWWKQLPEKQWPQGLGADMVDLQMKERQAISLPSYTDGKGRKVPAQFAAAAPDGESYLVVGKNLLLMSRKGKLLRRLTTGSEIVIARSVRYSPDGKRIVYASIAGGHRLQTMSLADGQRKEIEAGGKYIRFRARWSPDGKRLAYSCRKYDESHARLFGEGAYLKIAPADGGPAKNRVTEKAHPNGPALELTAWR